MPDRLLIFGLGYSGAAIANEARRAGWPVAATYRGAPPDWTGIIPIAFATAASAIATATHILSTVPPGMDGDPVLRVHAAAIRAAPALRWIGYLSTTGVYGDRAGQWVDETTAAAPLADRSCRRLVAEIAWTNVSQGRAMDIFRCAGIYGPGRSAFDDLRAGRARRVIRPGHAFGRIHRDDIAGAILAALAQNSPPGPRILHLADDEPAEPATIVAEAAALLGIAPPRETLFAEAWKTMSPMARSFWAENRKVSAHRTQAALHYRWRYPSYREGLRTILIEERAKGLLQ